MLVIDACIATKWFIPAVDTEEATALLNHKHQLIAPDLIRTEVSSAFLKLYNDKILDEEGVRQSINKWDKVLALEIIKLKPLDPYFSQAIEISMDLSCSLQSCLYLAVAERLNVPMITSDTNFFEKALAANHNVMRL